MAIADILYASVALFTLAIVFVTVFIIQDQLFPELEDRLDLTDPVVNATIQDAQAVFPLFDTMFAMMFFGVLIVIVLISFALPFSPVTAGITILGLIMTFLLTPVITNTFMEFGLGVLDQINVEITFPYMYYVFQNYPLFIMVFGFILAIILIARWRKEINV